MAAARALSRARVRLQRNDGQVDPRDLQERVARAIEELETRSGRFAHTFSKSAADAMATDATAETLLFQNAPAFDRKIEALTWTGAATVLSVTTPPNAAKIIVSKRRGGAPAAAVASLSNVGTSWPAFGPAKFELHRGLVLGAGEALTFAIEKTGAGVVVPAGLLTLWLIDV